MFRQFSPNMLKTYELCPKKFCFKYVKSLSMPADDTVFETGKNIHALASYYLKKENIDKMEHSLSDKEKEIWEFLKRIRYFSYNVINTEYNLAVKIGSHFFGGRLDALVKDETGKFYILDYKTGSAPKNATYDYQTMVYLLSVSKFYKTNDIEFVYIDLRNKKEVTIELTTETKKEYEEKLLKIADLIDSEDYTPRHDSCPCEYDIICF